MAKKIESKCLSCGRVHWYKKSRSNNCKRRFCPKCALVRNTESKQRSDSRRNKMSRLPSDKLGFIQLLMDKAYLSPNNTIRMALKECR